jgi:toxin-antitoxin system PIN domain toxin
VLVAAARRDHVHHHQAQTALAQSLVQSRRFGIATHLLAALVRVVSNRKAFPTATTITDAILAAETYRAHPHAVRIEPGDGHWTIFTQLLRATGVSGGAVSDVWHAALAIEHGCEWWTFDTDFAKFPGLRWRNLLA